MRFKNLAVNLCALMVLAVPCLAAVITSATVPAQRNTGDTITAAIWNNDVVGVYSYINNNIVAVLNVLTTKGDMYVYNGSALTRQPVGTDGQVLTADSAQVTGIKYAALANTTQLTTKGDLLGYSSTAARIPVGTNGQVLTADSTQTLGLKWAAPSGGIPTGSVVAWSPAFAGTNTIPSGWLLCDGTSGTPNLIGMFIIGGRPSGSVSAANASGYGVETIDHAGTGTTTHLHNVSGTVTSGAPQGTNNAPTTGTSTVYASGTHTHSVTFNNNSATASTEPADYTLVYLMKS